MSPLVAWENFYVIIGSSAAALTGLQFVVIALIAETRRKSSLREIDAFGTPTIVHFCGVLLVSATLSAPWRELSNAGLATGVFGAAGIVYMLIVAGRARRQTGYRPELEDWLWHAVFPLLAYAALLVAAILLPRDPAAVLFLIGAMTLFLLFIGIHNAWDTVTYVVVQWRHGPEKSDEKDSKRPA